MTRITAAHRKLDKAPGRVIMKSEFRSTSPEDATSIRQFFQKHQNAGSTLATVDAETMAWKYWSPHPYWEGSRSYVLKREGQIVAHGAVVPAWCVFGQDRFRAFHLIDWVASPTSQGAGTSLHLRVQQFANANFAVGGTDMTQQILPALGFRELGKSTKFVRPLRSLKRFTAAQGKSWRTVAQAGRSALWSLQAPGGPPSGWSAVSISKDELDGMAWPVADGPAAEGAFVERSAGVFAHLLKSPAAQFRFYTVQQKAGYFALALACGQVRIVDAWIHSDKPDDWRNLYLTAVATARAVPDAVEVVTVASDDRTRNALVSAGFHARGAFPIRFFSKTRTIPTLRFQLMDSDHAYLGAKQPGFWA